MVKHEKPTNFNLSIKTLYKTKYSEYKLGKESVTQINSFIEKISEKIMLFSNSLVKNSDRKTIGSRDIQDSIRLLFTENFAKEIISHATKSVTVFNSVHKDIDKSKRSTLAQKAEIIFSGSRSRNLMSKYTSYRIGETAPIYLASSLEYIISIIMHYGVENFLSKKRKTLTAKNISNAFKMNEDLDKVYQIIISN